MKKTNNLHIESFRPLIAPAILAEEIPLEHAAAQRIAQARQDIAKVLHGKSDRLVVVVGPCSIHDTEAAVEYAQKLHRLSQQLGDELLIVMRTYFEKPRTTVGWKGLINDPHLDGSFAINIGLRLARGVLRDIVHLGLPAACEFLDPISPQFITDLVAWGAIGARTTESQVHRELASGLSVPVGFKNGTDGNIRIAVEGVIAARHPHSFLGVTEQGLAAIVSTTGNPDCHVILRGGEGGPNYHTENVHSAIATLKKADLSPRLMVDVSHGNSGKDFRKQPLVAKDIADQLAAGESGIMGVMVESFLVEGRQEIKPGKIKYGQSITDGCLGWDSTVRVLQDLAGAVKKRRALKKKR